MGPVRSTVNAVHLNRTSAVVTIIALATYVTGLQKYVIDPVLGGFRDLAPGVQLLILAGIVAVVAGIMTLRARRRRADLLTAAEQVAAFGRDAVPAGTTGTS
jgi:uncharacterized membrane-anchored protein